jgi:integrase
MADPFRRGGVWILPLKDGAGRWRQLRSKAKTLAEARGELRELEGQARRQRLGLEPLPMTGPVKTFGDLMDWWWERHGSLRESKTIRLSVEKHFRGELGHLPLQQITPELFDALLGAREKPRGDRNTQKPLAPGTLNHLRAIALQMFKSASVRGTGIWRGPNPIAEVPRRSVPKRRPTYLERHEVPLVLREVGDQCRAVCAVAIYLGLRKGEVLGLLKEDVNLKTGEVTVRRSYGRDTTKGEHDDVLPISDELRPYLVDAIARSPAAHVFPHPSGRGYKVGEFALHKVVRRAMSRAGIVAGYLHKCRRRGCGYEVRADCAETGRCPKCEMRLWAKSIPKEFARPFHALRHTTATLLLKGKEPLQDVSKILRHSSPEITLNFYGHLNTEDLRTTVNTLRFASTSPTTPAQPTPDRSAAVPVAANAEPFTPCAPVVQREAEPKKEDPGSMDFSNEARAFKWSGRQDLNLRPLAPQASALPGCATPRKLLKHSVRRAPSASLTRDRQASIANDDFIRRLLRVRRRGCRRDLRPRSLPRARSRRSSQP